MGHVLEKHGLALKLISADKKFKDHKARSYIRKLILNNSSTRGWISPVSGTKINYFLNPGKPRTGPNPGISTPVLTKV